MLSHVAFFILWFTSASLGTPLLESRHHTHWTYRKFTTKRSPSFPYCDRQTVLTAQATTLRKFRNAPTLLAGHGTSPGYIIPSSLQNAYDRASDYADNMLSLRSLSESPSFHSLSVISATSVSILDGANSTAVDPLNDKTDGVNDYEYFGQMFFGSQSQVLQIDFDTGSADLWVPVDCHDCGGLTQFQPSASSTFRNSTRPFAVQYGMGQVVGTVVQDTVAVGSLKVANQTFGAVSSVSSNFANAPNDGLVGLAFSNIAETHAPTFFENLMSQLDAPLFSIYMTRTRVGGSEICFGCIDASKARGGDITWVPVVSKTYWTVNMTGVSVNNSFVPTNNVYALVDTGTSFIYAPQFIVSSIYAKISGATPARGYGPGFYAYPCDTQVAVSFELGGQMLAMDPRDMNLGRDTSDPSNTTCIGAIIGSTNRFAILGDSFCKKYLTVFDYSHGARVGFVTSIN